MITLKVRRSSKAKSSGFRAQVLLAVLAASFFQSFSPNLIVLVTEAQEEGQRKLEQVRTWPARAKRFALVIGVDEYQDPQINKLSGASNDAKALADALVLYAGFSRSQVILLTSDQPLGLQPTRANVIRRLSNLRQAVPADGLLLVSFAGHGIERNGRAYLLPMDAQVSGDVDLVEDSAINVESMQERIRQTGVKQVVVILDACRSNPLAARSNTANPLTDSYVNEFNFSLRNKDVIAFVTLYATGLGQVAYEYKDKKQGYFTWALVEGIKGAAANEKGEVTLEQLVRHVQDMVSRQVQIDLGNQQFPFADIQGYKANELVIAVVERPTSANKGIAGSQPTGLAIVENSPESSIKSTVSSLPASKPSVRGVVNQAIEEMEANSKGSMGSFWVEAPNAGTVWRKLYNQFHGEEIPELCKILGEAHDWNVYWKALTLLNYSAQQSKGIPLSAQILKAACDHIERDGHVHVQEAALDLVQKLRLPPTEIWKCLSDSLQIVKDRDAHKIIKVIVRFTPPDQKDHTGDAILNKFIYATEGSGYDQYSMEALDVLDYRKAIPALREILLGNDHYKIIYVAELLAKWKDNGSIPLMRRFIDTVHTRPGVNTHLLVLRSLYKLEGSRCAAYIAEILFNSSPDIQRGMAFVLEDFKNEPAVIDAMRRLVKTTTDPEVRKYIGGFLERLARDK